MTAIAFDFNEPVQGQTFQDVPSTNPFYPYIERLAGRNILNGYNCGGVLEPCVPPTNRPYFRPNTNITLGQTAKVVYGAYSEPQATATPTTVATATEVPAGTPTATSLVPTETIEIPTATATTIATEVLPTITVTLPIPTLDTPTPTTTATAGVFKMGH
jgi:hypothetical protein